MNIHVIDIPHGITVKELLHDYEDILEVVINDKYVPVECWETTIINETDTVFLFLVVKGGGGGGNKLLRTVLLVAVAVAAVAAAPYIAGALAGYGGPLTMSTVVACNLGTTYAAAVFGSYVIAGLAMIAASWLLYQIFPDPKQPTPQQAPGTEGQSLSSSKNYPKIYEVLPKTYGVTRIKPFLAATPDISVSNNDQIITALYYLNHGPIAIKIGNSEYYIGDTSYQVLGGSFTSYLSIKSIPANNTSGYDNKPFARLADNDITELLGTDPYFEFIIGTPYEILTRRPELNADKVLEHPNFVFNPYDDSNILKRSSSEKTHHIVLDDFKSTQLALSVSGDAYFRLKYRVEGDNTWYYYPPQIFNSQHAYYNLRMTKVTETGFNDGYYSHIITKYTADKYSNSAYDYRQYINNNITYLKRLIHSQKTFFGPGTYTIVDIKHLIDSSKKITEIYLESLSYDFSVGNVYKTNTWQYLGNSAINPMKVELHFYADRGLYLINDNGDADNLTIPFCIEYWHVSNPNYRKIKKFTMSGKQKSPIRTVIELDDFSGFASLDSSYIEFKVFIDTSFTFQNGKAHISDVTLFFVETTQRLRDPVNFIIGGKANNNAISKHSVIALLQISDKNALKGSIDNFDICFFGLIQNWLGSSDITKYKVSNNPAEVFVDALRHPGFIKPIPLSRIDLDELRTWRDWCNTFYGSPLKKTALPPVPNRYYPSFEFSYTINERISLLDLLKMVTASGLAKFTYKNGKFSVARDKKNLPVTQVITPRNSLNLKVSKTLAKKPDMIRIRYISKQSWETTETYVSVNPIVNSNQLLFTKDIIEVNTQTAMEEYQAQRIGMMYLANQQLRNEIYTLQMDIEAISFNVGDKVLLSYDTIAVGLSYARIKSIKLLSNKVKIVVDEVFPINPNKSQAVTVRYEANGVITASTYSVITAESSQKEIVLQTSTFPAQVGDLVVFGDSDSITIPCKVTNIQLDAQQNAQITLIEDVPQIHNIYELDTYPTYTPRVSSEPNYGLLNTRPPRIISITSGIF